MMFALLLAAAAMQADAAPALPGANGPDMAKLVDEAIDGGRIIQADAMMAQWRETGQPEGQAAIGIAAARLALAKGRNEEAEARFAAIEKAGTADCKADEGLGVARLRLGRAKAALKPLQRAVAACGQRWRAWNALAIVYDEQRDWTQSSAAYERAFQLTDKPETVLNNYGLSLMKQGEAAKAATIFEKAREIAPTDGRIIANGDSAAVMAGRDIARRRGDDADGWARRLTSAGQAALRMGDMARARAYLSRAMAEADSFMPETAAALATIGTEQR